MKRLLCIVFAALLCACTARIDAPNTDNPADVPTDAPAVAADIPEIGGYGDFCDTLSAALIDGTQNRNLSPISVYLAMAMVAEGANGDTQAELLKLLGCASLEELRGVCAALLETLSLDAGGSVLDIHNSLWMAEEIGGTPVTFREDYLAVLADAYRSEANTVRFGTLSAAMQIADWINTQTRGKINVQPSALNFDPSTLAVLINTIYLKDGWSDVFAPENTEEDTFYGINADTGEAQEINADFMRRLDNNTVLVQGDGWLRYSVRLNRIGYMTFVLPDEGIDLAVLLGSPEAIETLLTAGVNKTCNVSLRIPKFKFNDRMALEKVLEAMGLELSFTPAADFSGMSDANCMIDSVLQESFIGVDENGVEAAAYTMVSMRTTSFFNPVQLETLDFHLTRPFLFAIESLDGTLLFVGTVTAPSEHEVPRS
mgnify:CR=1 FL=1